jgi:hypothetical protein
MCAFVSVLRNPTTNAPLSLKNARQRDRRISLLAPMTVRPRTKSTSNGHGLASDHTSTAAYPEQSMTTTTTTMTATTTTTTTTATTIPSSSSQSDDDLKLMQVQVLDYVDAEEDSQEAKRNHEPEKRKGKASNRGGDNVRPVGTAPTASVEPTSLFHNPPGLLRNLSALPAANVAMTAQLVPEEYRRDKDVDQNRQESEAGFTLRGPGAYSVRPTNDLVQDESTNANDDDEEVMPGTNDEHNESAFMFDDPESALDAQVVPERDLNREVQQKLEAMTIDPIAVAKSKSKNNAPNGPPGTLRKSVLIIILGALMVLVAVGSVVGILASKKRKEHLPTSAPKVQSDIELARSIFAPLTGDEALWDESSPQYKALWWIVHEDPVKKMVKLQDEVQSSSNMIVERFVMALFYFATDGPNWLTSYDFLGNSSICDWNDSREFDNGVQCNNEGSAVQLFLGKFVVGDTVDSFIILYPGWARVLVYRVCIQCLIHCLFHPHPHPHQTNVPKLYSTLSYHVQIITL